MSKHVLIIAISLVVIIASGGIAFAGPPSNIMREHLFRANTPFSFGTYITFDENGTRAPIERIPAKEALSVAANYYVIVSEDFSVSIQDLLDSGYWPYDIFPDDCDRLSLLYNYPSTRGLDLDETYSGAVFDNIGSPDWILYAKNDILNSFHGEYYFDVDLRPELDDLAPRRNAAFWINPISGNPMKEGSDQGDFSHINVSFLRPSFDSSNAEYQLDVPILNLDVALPTDDLQSLCCEYERKSQNYAAEHEHKYTWRCYCHGLDLYQDCTVKWKYDCSSYASFWVFVQYVDCNSPVPEGHIKRNCGDHAPDSIVGALCIGQIISVSCTTPVNCVNDPIWDVCWEDYQDFLDNIEGPSIPSAVSFPGPLCNCE